MFGFFKKKVQPPVATVDLSQCYKRQIAWGKDIEKAQRAVLEAQAEYEKDLRARRVQSEQMLSWGRGFRDYVSRQR